MSNDKKLMEEIQRLRKQIETLITQTQFQKKQKNYSYQQASELLCISVEGLKSRIKRGQMQRVSNGNRPLIQASEIERFLNKQNPTN